MRSVPFLTQLGQQQLLEVVGWLLQQAGGAHCLERHQDAPGLRRAQVVDVAADGV
jgi:hypothetical protein